MNKTKLSREGQERRDEMLTDLQNEVTLVGRRRTSRRVATAIAPIVLLAIGFWWLTDSESTNRPVELVQETVEPNKTELIQPYSVEQVVVSNRSGIVQRYVVNTNDALNSNAHAISDEELLDLLALAGKPSVLGRIDGRLTVIPINSSLVSATN